MLDKPPSHRERQFGTDPSFEVRVSARRPCPIFCRTSELRRHPERAEARTPNDSLAASRCTSRRAGCRDTTMRAFKFRLNLIGPRLRGVSLFGAEFRVHLRDFSHVMRLLEFAHGFRDVFLGFYGVAQRFLI